MILREKGIEVVAVAATFCISEYAFTKVVLVIENAGKEIIHILVARIYTQGLISRATYQNADSLLNSAVEMPFHFCGTLRAWEGRKNRHGYTENSC